MAEQSPENRLIYLANPNNPREARSRERVCRFSGEVRIGVLVVLDEAYIHYAVSVGLRDSVEAYRKRKNLLILRTFSKMYGWRGCGLGMRSERRSCLWR